MCLFFFTVVGTSYFKNFPPIFFLLYVICVQYNFMKFKNNFFPLIYSSISIVSIHRNIFLQIIGYTGAFAPDSFTSTDSIFNDKNIFLIIRYFEIPGKSRRIVPIPEKYFSRDSNLQREPNKSSIGHGISERNVSTIE